MWTLSQEYQEQERQEGEEEHAAGTELWLHTCSRRHHRILRKTWSAQRQPRSRTARQTCRRASDSRTRELLSPSRVFVTCPLSAKAFSRSAIFAWQLLSSICSCSRVYDSEERPSGYGAPCGYFWYPVVCFQGWKEGSVLEHYKPWPPAQHPENPLFALGEVHRPAAGPGTLGSTGGNEVLTLHVTRSITTVFKDIKDVLVMKTINVINYQNRSSWPLLNPPQALQVCGQWGPC